jgi:hypothetical protein
MERKKPVEQDETKKFVIVVISMSMIVFVLYGLGPLV